MKYIFKTIKKMLEDEKYNVSYKLLKCDDYGIPQMRKRVFIVACLGSINPNDVLNVESFKKKTTLSEYMNMNFEISKSESAAKFFDRYLEESNRAYLPSVIGQTLKCSRSFHERKGQLQNPCSSKQ